MKGIIKKDFTTQNLRRSKQRKEEWLKVVKNMLE